MNILIIGYGSIGKRHYEVLQRLDTKYRIDLVTRQVVSNAQTFKSLELIDQLSYYDYFIISSETVKHYEQLKYLCSKVDGKIILVEKPLYDKYHRTLNCNNKVFTAYNLRFHPLLVRLHTLLEKEKIYYANIICGQYLPTWRPEQDYKKSYSADIDRGGGVLRDLSHELDYAIWLFGSVDKINAINTKISDLEIHSDDIFTAILMTTQKVIVNVTVDYISKRAMRKLIIHTQESTIEADINENTLLITHKNNMFERVKLDDVDRNFTYIKMHEAILSNQTENMCSFEEGQKVMEIINDIEFEKVLDVSI